MQIKATDPYLWLEDIHGAQALEWVKAQNTKTAAVLKSDVADTALCASGNRAATARTPTPGNSRREGRRGGARRR